MQFDVFFSICQTEVDGYLPDERTMLRNFFDQVQVADEAGYGTAWIAETHLSTEVQKRNPNGVVPHFTGEIGLNTDVLQMAHHIFARTKKLHVGSAIRNIQCNGGPIAHAEAVRTFLSLREFSRADDRNLELGFAAGRFEFSNRPYGIRPRNEWEAEAWPVVKGKIFHECTEIFLRCLKSEILSSDDIAPRVLRPRDFRNPETDWQRVTAAYGREVDEIELPNRWNFETLQVIPKEAGLERLRLTIGSHDPEVQRFANTFMPCGVFNLSITPSAQIERTHEMMQEAYHADGGPWHRGLMPRTVLVFMHQDVQQAQEMARKAIANYWKAMMGTIDNDKVENAVENALAGNPESITRQLRESFHPDDRLMLWFDFNNHDSEAIQWAMRTFMDEVAPAVNA